MNYSQAIHALSSYVQLECLEKWVPQIFHALALLCSDGSLVNSSSHRSRNILCISSLGKEVCVLMLGSVRLALAYYPSVAG